MIPMRVKIIVKIPKDIMAPNSEMNELKKFIFTKSGVRDIPFFM